MLCDVSCSSSSTDAPTSLPCRCSVSCKSSCWPDKYGWAPHSYLATTSKSRYAARRRRPTAQAATRNRGTQPGVPGTLNMAATAASDEGFKTRRMPQAQQGSDFPVTCTYMSWVMLCKFGSI